MCGAELTVYGAPRRVETATRRAGSHVSVKILVMLSSALALLTVSGFRRLFRWTLQLGPIGQYLPLS